MYIGTFPRRQISIEVASTGLTPQGKETDMKVQQQRKLERHGQNTPTLSTENQAKVETQQHECSSREYVSRLIIPRRTSMMKPMCGYMNKAVMTRPKTMSGTGLSNKICCISIVIYFVMTKAPSTDNGLSKLTCIVCYRQSLRSPHQQRQVD
jgi:hypothetical protein